MKVDARRKGYLAYLDHGADYQVTLIPVEGTLYPTWHVLKDDKAIGAVAKSTRTWERRTPGKRYVNARGTVTAWYIINEGQPLSGFHRGLSYDTRNAAIRALVKWHAEAEARHEG